MNYSVMRTGLASWTRLIANNDCGLFLSGLDGLTMVQGSEPVTGFSEDFADHHGSLMNNAKHMT